jgi:putative phosphoesterase
MPRGNRALPAPCIERLRAAELVIHAGDLTGISFLRELRHVAPALEAIHGNMDDAEVRAALPAELVLEVDGIHIGVVHEPGPRRGHAERLSAKFPGCAAVVYGHTHLPEVEQTRGVWILNPGSPTERRRAPHRTMLEVLIEGETLRPQLISLDP